MQNVSTVLITGANGFIGQHLLAKLTPNYEITAISRQNSSINQKNLTWINADLTRPDFVEKLPTNIDAVICLAQSNHYRDFPEFAEDIFQVNIQSLFYLLEWSRKIGLKKFIYSSSANIYNQTDGLINEDKLLSPNSFYAKSKLIAEMLINSYQSYFATTVLRLFTVYGPRQKNALIPTLIENIRLQKPVKIYGKSGIKLSPIFVSDVCQIFEKILATNLHDEAATFNVCGSEKIDILQISTTIGQVLDLQPIYEFHDSDDSKGWVGDNTKLQKSIGRLTLTSFKKGLQLTVNEK